MTLNPSVLVSLQGHWEVFLEKGCLLDVGEPSASRREPAPCSGAPGRPSATAQAPHTRLPRARPPALRTSAFWRLESVTCHGVALSIRTRGEPTHRRGHKGSVRSGFSGTFIHSRYFQSGELASEISPLLKTTPFYIPTASGPVLGSRASCTQGSSAGRRLAAPPTGPPEKFPQQGS